MKLANSYKQIYIQLKVNALTFKILKESDFVESVENIGISDDKTNVWYAVVFKDGDTIDIVAPKYNVN